MKHLLYLIAAALVIGGCSGGSSGQTQGGPNFGQMQRATSVEATDVTRNSISQVIRAYGTIRAQDNVRVTPQISERVMRIHADLGDTVNQGQLLAKLRDVNFVDQVRRDEAQLEQARIAVQRDSTELNRARALHERNLISDAELDNVRVAYQNSRTSYQSARASLTQSRENLGFTEVRSPVYGVVTRRNISPGDVASSANPMFEIANLVGYEMRIFMPLADRRVTRVGQEVSLRLSGERESTASGIVSRISPELDPVTGLAEVVISLTDVRGEILPGSLAEAAITVLTRPESIVVPRAAMVENVQTVLDPESNTIRLNRTYSAFVAVGDSVAQQRELEIGLEQGDRIEVLSGLNEGDRLIVTGQGGLEDGSRIRVTTRTRPGAEPQRQIQVDSDGRPVRPDGAPAGRQQRPGQDSGTTSNNNDGN